MITTMMTTAASSAAAAAAAATATVLFVASLRIADAGNSHTAQLAFTAQYVRANIVFRRRGTCTEDTRRGQTRTVNATD